MQKEFKPGKEVFDKLAGIYTMRDKSMMEFYKDGDTVSVKWNGQIIAGICYRQ